MTTWRGWWWRLPWLPAVVLAAAVWGAVVGVLLRTVPLDRGGEPWSTTAAVLGGVAAALLAGVVVTAGRGEDLRHADALDGRRAREAVAASSGGAVPVDPEVRAAALRMVFARFQRVAGAGRAGVVGPAVGLGLGVVAQFGVRGVDSWVPWLLLVGAVLLAVTSAREPRRLQRRILELAPPVIARRPGDPGWTGADRGRGRAGGGWSSDAPLVPGGPGLHTGAMVPVERWWSRRSPLEVALLTGAVAAVVTAVAFGSGPSPTGAPGDAGLGLVYGLVLGTALGVSAGAARQRVLRLSDETDPRRARAALAASQGGAVPADDRLRRGALQLAVARLAQTRPRAGLLALVVLAGLGAVWWSWWAVSPAPWVFAALVVWQAVGETRAPRRLQRRILELDTDRVLRDDGRPAPAAP